ncbi:hypothetical protein GCM10020001_109200 [Nonomuraea salmonea]
MGDQHGRAVEVGEVAAQLGADCKPGVGVERGQRLVQQEQLGPYGERTGQRHPLRLPTGQLPRPGTGPIGQPHAFQQLGGGAAGLGLGHTLAARPEGDVVERGQVREEQVVLEHHADRPALGGQGVQRPAPQRDVTCGQAGEPGQRPQRRRLAGPVRAEQRHHLTGGGVQRGVEGEGGPGDHQAGIEGHGALTHRSRRLARMTTDTASRTRLSTMAASGSVSSAR